MNMNLRSVADRSIVRGTPTKGHKMTKTVQVRYVENEAQYRAEFYAGKTLLQSKALTSDEAEALSEVSTLPSVGELVTLQAWYLKEELEQIGSIDFESNFFTLLEELAR